MCTLSHIWSQCVVDNTNKSEIKVEARPTAGFPIRDLKTTRRACQHRERGDKSCAPYLSAMRMLLALANLCSRLTASGGHAKKVCDSARGVSILSKLSSTLVLTCDSARGQVGYHREKHRGFI